MCCNSCVVFAVLLHIHHIRPPWRDSIPYPKTEGTYVGSNRLDFAEKCVMFKNYFWLWPGVVVLQ